MNKIKVNGNLLIFLAFALISILSLSSCGDDPDNPSGLTGWYVDKSSLASSADFVKINNAISNNEVLSQYTYGGTTHKYIASRSLFFYDDGMWRDGDAYFGKLRFSVDLCINVYRIIDDNTIARYIGYLYDLNSSGTKGKDKLYSFNAGGVFGILAYYGTPTYYTYVKNGNKIVTTNGDIFTISSSGLIMDGSSKILSKYNP